MLSLLSVLACAFALPITPDANVAASNGINTVAATDAAATNAAAMVPLIYVNNDGSLWVGDDVKHQLSLAQAQQALAAINNPGLTKRALTTTVHCCGGSNGCNDPCAPPPCDPRDPCSPCYDPCYTPCDPCDPNCNNGCGGCGGECGDELRASCYTKWFCPGTYCGNGACGEGLCPEDPCHPRGYHPVVDGLRSCCATKWFCPSTYCPHNWAACADASCADACAPPPPCTDPCAPSPPPCENHWNECNC